MGTRPGDPRQSSTLTGICGTREGGSCSLSEKEGPITFPCGGEALLGEPEQGRFSRRGRGGRCSLSREHCSRERDISGSEHPSDRRLREARNRNSTKKKITVGLENLQKKKKNSCYSRAKAPRRWRRENLGKTLIFTGGGYLSGEERKTVEEKREGEFFSLQRAGFGTILL